MCSYNRKRPNVFLTAKEIEQMRDDEEIGVNRNAINSRIVKLQLQKSTDKEAISILMKVNREIAQKEKGKSYLVFWGAKMTVKDVKRAFGNLDGMLRTSFRKI